MNNISHLKPSEVWSIFNAISAIPRPSGQEEEVIEYLTDLFLSRKLEVSRDKIGNLIVRKKASAGMENSPCVTLQAHLDMVAQKNKSKKHDFTKDPIELVVDGDWLRANETTLGADNGIGVAMISALLLSDSAKHAPIEALFTINEEAGMEGVHNLEAGTLKGEILLNLDSEQEGEFCIGCAGGIDLSVNHTFTSEALPKNYTCYRVELKGLLGGHSGVDIHLTRGNANTLLARWLSECPNLKLHSIQGGSLRNAIAREASAIIAVPQTNSLLDFNHAFVEIIKTEFGSNAYNFSIQLNAVEQIHSTCSSADTKTLLSLIIACPDGVLGMNPDRENTVDTSSNLAMVELENNQLQISFLIRSSRESSKSHAVNRITALFENSNYSVSTSGVYPGWEPEKTNLLEKAKSCYAKLYNKEAKVIIMHAGLECGLIKKTHPTMQMLSFGPTIMHPHSPREKVEIQSVERSWEYLLNLLQVLV